MALRQHRGNDVPFGREIKQREKVVDRLDVGMVLRAIDFRKLIDHGVHFKLVVLERQARIELQLRLRRSIRRIPVKHGAADVHPLGCEGDVITVGSRTHREQESSPQQEVSDVGGHRAFHLADLLEPHDLGRPGLLGDLLLVPRSAAIGPVKFAVLPRKVFVVKVEPIVFGQFSRQDRGVVDHVVWDFGVGQNQGHSIVPWLFALGTVHRNFGRNLQLYPLHVDFGVCNLLQDLACLHIRNHLMRHAADDTLVLDFRNVGQQKASASVVQQPLHLHPIFQHPKRHPVGLQVVGLAVVHGHQNACSPHRLKQHTTHQGQTHTSKRFHHRFKIGRGRRSETQLRTGRRRRCRRSFWNPR